MHPDASTVRQEPWAKFWPEARTLAAQHMAEVGERDGVPLDPDVELFAILDRIGALQVSVARSNGRMFGYLVTIISPSLECRGMKVATPTAFYVSPEARGIGWKLLREAIAAMRAQGVQEVQMRAGTRGDGPRLGIFYRRLGARDHGQLFSLVLGGA